LIPTGQTTQRAPGCAIAFPVPPVVQNEFELGLFASKQYLENHPKIGKKEELRGHRFVGYIDDLLFDQDLRFIEELYPGGTPIFRTSTVIAQMSAVVAGTGIGVIPYFMAHIFFYRCRIILSVRQNVY
jgi:DNA-binding transcriptional LysR family regulator